jgi:predicted Fe-Mo cluster-binding NifX family protein
MKIVVSASDNRLEGSVQERFGRARWFLIYDHVIEGDKNIPFPS